MASSVEDESVDSEIKEMIEEIEEKSDYSLDFDDDDRWHEDAVDNDTPQQQQPVLPVTSVVSTDDEPDVRGLSYRSDTDAHDASRAPLSIKPSPAAAADMENDTRALKDAAVRPIPIIYDNPPPKKRDAKQRAEPTSNVPEMDRVALDRKDEDTSPIPVQLLNLETRQDKVKHSLGGEDSEAVVKETLTVITRDHPSLREILGNIQQELLDARQKVVKKAASTTCAAQKKRVLAGAHRMRYLEQVAEARRATAAAKASVEALRARLEDGERECGRTREILEAARLAKAKAEKRADDFQKEAEAAKNEAEPLRRSLAEVQRDFEEQRKQAAIAARNASNELELCEKKRELEVTAAREAAEARERAAELELQRIPEHHQRLLQAELDRVARWEERLAAESVSLQRREETHKIEVEAYRAKANRVEAESRARAEEDIARERTCLKEARSAFEDQREELLRRVTTAEAVGQARAAEAAAMKAEATDTMRRIEVEKSELNTRAELLAPKFQALEERRTALELARKEVREEARRANQEACRAREMEAGVIEREAAVETRWKEIAAARRAIKQMEKTVAEESEALAGQRKALSLARYRLHEQQMETSLQISEIRQALDVLKRVEDLEDRGVRRLAMDIGTLALHRRARTAEPEEVDFETDVSVSREPEHTTGSRRKRNATINCAPAGASTSEGVKSISREVAGPPGKTDESTHHGSEIIGYSREALHDAGTSQYSGVYAEEANTWDVLDKVRSVIASS